MKSPSSTTVAFEHLQLDGAVVWFPPDGSDPMDVKNIKNVHGMPGIVRVLARETTGVWGWHDARLHQLRLLASGEALPA